MPELPEVETTINYLKPALLNKVIQQVVFGKNAGSIFNRPLPQVADLLTGQSVSDIRRHGKFMLFEFASQAKAVGHLRMSGRYMVTPQPVELPHTHFSLVLPENTYISYVDQRRFGTFHFVDDFANYSGLQRLGPDVWLSDISSDYLHGKLRNRKTTIYQALLDQSILAGLGNIYVNEILFRAKVLPSRLASSVNRDEIAEIISFIKPVLAKSLELKGTTLIDNLYRDPEGNSGEFAKLLQVYDRDEKPCLRCNGVIQSIRLGGRSAYFCAKCQN